MRGILKLAIHGKRTVADLQGFAMDAKNRSGYEIEIDLPHVA